MADLNSPEHRSALAARRAHGASGAHIKDRPSSDDVVAYDAGLPEDITDIVHRLAKLESTREQEASDVSLPKARFDSSINIGNILTIIIMVLGGIAAYGTYTSDMAKRDARLDALQVQITENKKVTDDRAAHYAPMVDEARRMNESQNTRQDNFVDSLKNMRDMLSEVIKTMQEQARANAEMHEAVTVLRMQLERINQSGPRNNRE